MKAIRVSQLNTYIKNIFDAEELLHNISVVGEVFGVNITRNIMYFSLRDEDATLSCVCFYPNMFPSIKEGSEIIATGSPNYYVKGGKLSFVVNNVELGGQGKLYEEFLKLKDKLEKEGLFDKAHKKPIPEVIKRIGVITSRDGAVIQDIKNVGWRRNPALDIVLFSTRVQGKGAENEIAHAIDMMGNYDNIDVIVVARGGGSLEDLWAYNTEIVARATYNCPKPIVSAVGHETDFTIIDFVSDLRAPTPSAAAELLTIKLTDKKEYLRSLRQSLILTFEGMIGDKQKELASQIKYLINDFEKTILNKSVILNRKTMQFKQEASRYIDERAFQLGLMENSLNKLNPSLPLEKGYARVEQNGKVIKTKSQVEQDLLEIFFKDGSLLASPIKDK